MSYIFADYLRAIVASFTFITCDIYRACRFHAYLFHAA